MSLSSWPDWISDFHLLNTLDLSLNPLNSIPDNAFNNLKYSLLHLYLSGTGLTHIPKALSILTNLTSLDLNNNNFTDTSEFTGITASTLSESLSYIDLNSCGLTRMPNFSNFMRLDTIILSNNRISDVPTGSLPSSLTSVYCLNNSLSSVPEDVASMSRLSVLDLSYNRITGIETDSLPSSLTYLRLDINNVTIITNTTFRNLNLLSTLDLSFNPISEISPAAFSDLVSLESLNLLGSHLTEIPLALTRLNPDIHLYFTTTEPLSCPCPAPQVLIKWASAVGTPTVFQYFCGNGQKAKDYLSGQCGQSLAAA
ncbi:unnamed protein product [Candidula unifasciata]|uniref:L domain-like protein n=1 Tax=Candidula unifasciata TaxID=100452 RepID=A0A8S3YVX5_9EUPU|nr:unnamed protein product [Candidula unifasciata]